MKATLDKWGYEYNYSRSGVKITGKPELPDERLKEILIRKLDLDIQIDPFAFAYFLCAFTDIAGFDSMPWEERAIQMYYKYDIEVSDRTLRNWCKKLIEKDLIQKLGRETCWKTQYSNGVKYRTKVAEDDKRMEQYFQKREKLLRRMRKNADDLELEDQEGRNKAWTATYKKLWRKFGCCYYRCRGIVFNAIGEDFVWEIYELARELAAPPPRSPSPKPENINTKEKFHEEWFA